MGAALIVSAGPLQAAVETRISPLPSGFTHIAAPTYTPALEVAFQTEKDEKETPTLKEDIKSISLVFARSKKTLFSDEALKQRIMEDAITLQKLLFAYGYYDPVITTRYDAVNEKDGLPVLTVHVETGPTYSLSQYNIKIDPARGLAPASLEKLGITLQQHVLSSNLLSAEKLITADLANQGYPFAQFTKRDYVVDHDAHTMAVQLVIDPGKIAYFGNLEINGLRLTKKKFIEHKVTWKEGDVFSPQQIEDTRAAILGSEIFSVVKVDRPEQPSDHQSIPITIDLIERKPRTLSASAGYSTDQGPGVEIGWEHRNLWGGGQKLDVDGIFYANKQSLESNLRLPSKPDKKSNLLFGLKAENETSDAYDSTGITAQIGMEKELSRWWKGSIGTKLFYGSVNGETVSDLSFPVTATYDSTDSPLNPTRGLLSSSSITPYLSVAGGETLYTTWSQKVSTYYDFKTKGKYIIAGWAHLGGMIAGNVMRIPETNRFYSGGGGSVRGYEYQSIGQHDDHGDPIGGKSLAEGGLELRVRFNDKWGGVLFTEAGSVGDTLVPDFGEPQYSAGIGARYFTSFAPIRADLAVPLNARKSDGAFQFYISIGQAF